jgi:RNA polymerase sigma factor (sigma-70 family)
MTDRDLLERFVTANDADAFRDLIDCHGPMVIAVCRSILREPHDVEDAFQNTFLALARRAGSIKQTDSIAPWLHRVAFRVAQRARRLRSRYRSVERIRPESEPACPSQPRDLSFVPLLREELSRLPEGYRQPVVLCYLDGKTNEEAAAQLKCPVGTIKGRLWRARQTLRDRLRRRGLDLYSGSLGVTARGCHRAASPL